MLGYPDLDYLGVPDDLRRRRVSSFTRDATSLKGIPQTAAEWTSLGVTVACLWKCQEPSGNLTDTVGSVTLTAAGTPLYQQAITDWTSKGIQSADAGAQRFTVASGTPNPAAGSVAMLVYLQCTTNPAAIRNLFMVSNSANPLKVILSTAGKLTINCNGVSTTGASVYTDSTVHPVLLMFDKTNTVVKIFTDLEQFTGTYSAGVTDGTKALLNGAGGASGAAETIAYAAAMTGASAEGLTKTFLSNLGWSLAY